MSVTRYEELREILQYAYENAPAVKNIFDGASIHPGDIQTVRELEKGVELAPESPQMHFALARAYAKVGRSEDARRAREEFLRLDELVREREEKGNPMVPPRGEAENQESPSQH